MDQIQEAAGNPYTLLAVIISSLASIAVAYIYRQRQNANAPDSIRVAGEDIDTSHADNRVVTLLQSITTLYDRKIEDQDKRIGSLERSNENLTSQTLVLKPEVRKFAVWEDSGKPEPSPSVSTDARQVLEMDPL